MKAFRGRDRPRLAWKRRSYRLLRQVAPCADRQEAAGHRFEGGAGVVRKFFDDEQFNFEFQFALGGVHYGAGDLGEMLSTADRVVDGDADSWCREWIATGQRLATIAKECAKSGHRVSARAAYLRAATYYAVALSSVDGTKDPDTLLRPTFAGHRRCFDAEPARGASGYPVRGRDHAGLSVSPVDLG